MCVHIPRVVSSLMSKFINESVKLLAQFMEIDEANSIAKVRDCSNTIIIVYNFKCDRFVTKHEEWIEVTGISKGKTHLYATTIKTLPSSNYIDFDKDIYTETIKLLQTVALTNNFIICNIEEHWGAEDHAELLKESKPDDEVAENDIDESTTCVFAL